MTAGSERGPARDAQHVCTKCGYVMVTQVLASPPRPEAQADAGAMGEERIDTPFEIEPCRPEDHRWRFVKSAREVSMAAPGGLIEACVECRAVRFSSDAAFTMTVTQDQLLDALSADSEATPSPTPEDQRREEG